MKKVLIVAMLTIALSACGGSSTATSQRNSGTQAPSAATNAAVQAQAMHTKPIYMNFDAIKPDVTIDRHTYTNSPTDSNASSRAEDLLLNRRRRDKHRKT